MPRISFQNTSGNQRTIYEAIVLIKREAKPPKEFVNQIDFALYRIFKIKNQFKYELSYYL